ncbi:MAG: glutamine-hydrolyzing carbamoyl-phosphate synthase small subunit [Candidatus Aenigmarchaeota archaeon]|nr:glutamine-hydrolyzing carbamoyl-phosphate synthase small subunit [Candidatus Aenigmarchaeota archaeon]
MKYLVLEDGTVFRGVSFGFDGETSGEVVFNTGMTGYTESLTDPSYKGQILCQTYPLIGNYGVRKEDEESPLIHARGYVVSEHYTEASKTIDAFLKEHRVPGISGIDTRMLAKILRTRGAMLGGIFNAPDVREMYNPNKDDLVSMVTTQKIKEFGAGKTVALIDCGVKMNIIRSLVQRNLRVIVVPATSSASDIMALNPSGLVVSNGPGDPQSTRYVVDTLQNLLEYRLPMFGICLGIQLLGAALGANTYKLKFGHRGQNHPCMDTKTKRCYMTSQNHGFALRGVPENAEATMIDMNDGTIEGFEHKTLPIFAVQFHPEAAPGPQDTSFLFDKFARMLP